jgi:hypothetical protein
LCRIRVAIPATKELRPQEALKMPPLASVPRVPPIDWGTVWQATVTAVLVTLLIEYLAKPRLEARKARVLDALAARRELAASLVSVGLAAGFLKEAVPPPGEGISREPILLERARQLQQLRERTQALYDNAGRYASVYPGPARDRVVNFIFTTWGVVMSQRTTQRKAELVTDLVRTMAVIVDARPWAPLRYARAMERLETQLCAAQESQV